MAIDTIYLQSAIDVAAADATTKSANAAGAMPSRMRLVLNTVVPAVAVGASQTVTISWNPAFPTTNYIVLTSLSGTMGTVQLGDFVASAKANNSCTLTVRNLGVVALLASALTIDVLIVHSPLQ